MALPAGTRFGPYEILERVGAGGMGEVYRARDTNLDREVAVKVLPQAVTGDSDLLARLEREAKMLAALNHPNIAQVYALEAGALVMEFADGETLAQIIKRGPIPLATALDYARQIAEALDCAHLKGIVHRDLKPANIIITAGDQVKVLDFGLAKIFEEAPVRSAKPALANTVTLAFTNPGIVMGSAAYMSPEQAAGKMVDKRSDIWSFGAVLYEMITGKMLFNRETVSETLAAVLLAEVDLSGLPASTPHRVRHLLRGCLERDMRKRLRDIGDARYELDSPEPEMPGGGPPQSRRRQILFWAGWLTAAAVALAASALRLFAPSPPPRPVLRTAITLPGNAFVTPVVSRDGTRLLYGEVGLPSRLWLRMLDQLEGHPIPGTEAGERGTLSPDGQWIAFLKGPAPYQLAKIPIAGGNPTILSSDASFITTPYWTDEGSILAGSLQGIMRVPSSGGKLEALTALDRKNGEVGHFEPFPLPDGRGILFTVGSNSNLDIARYTARIGVLDLKSRTYRVLPGGGSTPAFIPTGHLVYRRGGTLFAMTFDVRGLAASGPETAVLEGLSGGLAAGGAPYTFTPSGLLLYRLEVGSETSRESTMLTWMDRKGISQALPQPPRQWQTVPISPDGKKLVGDLLEAGSGLGKERIWIYDMDRGVLTPLTTGEGDHHPIWSPDGRSITFASTRGGTNGIYRMPSDSSRQPELLLATESTPFPYCWSPDGRTLVYYQFQQDKTQIFLLPFSAEGIGKPFRFHPESVSAELQPMVSPDGKWLAYTSNQSGRYEIYASAFPGPGATIQISNQGGRLPMWSRNGRELFYVEPSPRRLMAVDLSRGPTQPGVPQFLFTIRSDQGNVYYDVAPDTKRFLVLLPSQGESSSPSQTKFMVVSEWFQELLRRAPLKK